MDEVSLLAFPFRKKNEEKERKILWAILNLPFSD